MLFAIRGNAFINGGDYVLDTLIRHRGEYRQSGQPLVNCLSGRARPPFVAQSLIIGTPRWIGRSQQRWHTHLRHIRKRLRATFCDPPTQARDGQSVQGTDTLYIVSRAQSVCCALNDQANPPRSSGAARQSLTIDYWYRLRI